MKQLSSSLFFTRQMKVSFYVIRKKPYLKCSLSLSLSKKWPAKISRFYTESPAF